VWSKTNGGMGSFYRSRHELVFVFKIGTAPHVNTFGLGETGRKARALVTTKLGDKTAFGFEDRVKSLAIEEAYRLITIREGDRTERIPVIQAILRKVAVAAANGNIRAQQNYLNLLIGAETARREASTQMLKIAIDYKEHWHHVLAERARKGTTGPEPVPHPDEVIIDHRTGEVRIEGPVLEEQREARNRLRDMRPHCEQTLKEINEELASDPDDSSGRRLQKRLTKILEWLRKDDLKRRARDARMSTDNKSSKD
jgi:Family of unknown function (DUF5681)